jgi:Flp pilus assembly pilin Flp
MSFSKSAANFRICTSLNKLGRDIGGATAIEYAFIAAGVALALAIVVWGVGDELVPIFDELVGAFPA